MRRPVFIFLLFCLCGITSLKARDIVPFNDKWFFKKDSLSTEVTIPHTWNATDMQIKAKAFYEGSASYRKSCLFPESWKGKRLFLRFEGVGSCAEVYVNGKLTGSHKGGYSAFTCEIQNEIKFGEENEIKVLVDNTARPDVIPVNHNLFGIYGGIYRPVWLIITDSCNIAVTDHASSGVYISQKNVSRQSAEISVKVKLDNNGLHPVPVILENVIYDVTGKQIAAERQSFDLQFQGMQTRTSHFKLKRPHLWQGREDPYLYKVTSRLYQNGKVIDEISQPLGVRNYEIIAGKGFFLNGKKYPMYGVARHQDWWETGAALSNEQHDTDLAFIMDIGATTVRFAHYQQSEYLYSRCDSLGLIIWAEIPFVNRVTSKEWENAHNQLRELIRQSFNHPSIYVWGLHNEVYQPHAYTAQLTRSLHDLAKTEDPGRYSVAVNGYGHAEHPVNMQADIQGMNRYFGWYEKKIRDIDAWVEHLETEYPEMKLMLTEYGADANLQHQTEFLGESLNWTKEFYPETFQTKTHEYQWAAITKHPYIIASYVWNMFDFACPMWERGGVPARNMKGLVTFDRKTLKDSYFWYKANWSKNPVLYLTQRRNNQRETRTTSVTVYSNLGTPKVFLNGKALDNIRKGYTEVHYIIDNVTLANGENKLQAVITDRNGKEYADEIIWHYQGEQYRSTDNRENRNEHSGF